MVKFLVGRLKDWSDYAGMPYFGAVTGDANETGINGALMQRQGPSPEENQPVNAFTCTIIVEDYDSTDAKILQNGGLNYGYLCKRIL